MSSPILSILIPTVTGREDSLNKLILQISKQVGLSFTEVKQKGEQQEHWHYFSSNKFPIWIIICRVKMNYYSRFVHIPVLP